MKISIVDVFLPCHPTHEVYNYSAFETSSFDVIARNISQHSLYIRQIAPIDTKQCLSTGELEESGYSDQQFKDVAEFVYRHMDLNQIVYVGGNQVTEVEPHLPYLTFFLISEYEVPDPSIDRRKLFDERLQEAIFQLGHMD